MVAIDDERVLEQCRRCALPEAIFNLELPEVRRPLSIAVHVVAINTAGSERAKNESAVGDWRGGSETAGGMVALMRYDFAGNSPPKSATGSSIKAKNHEL